MAARPQRRHRRFRDAKTTIGEKGLANRLVFCFCSHMLADNDNRPTPVAARVLPILGGVAPDGRIVLAPPAASADPAPAAGSPSDPREA